MRRILEFIYTWVRNIILFSLLASIALELIPSDNYKNYTQLFVGFLIIFLVIEPITTVLGSKDNISLEAMQQFISIDTRQIEDDCEQLRLRETKRKKELYEAQIEQQIKEILEAENYKLYSQNVDISLGEENIGKIDKIEIVVQKQQQSLKEGESLEKEREGEKVKKIIKDFYQLDDSHIDVKMQE